MLQVAAASFAARGKFIRDLPPSVRSIVALNGSTHKVTGTLRQVLGGQRVGCFSLTLVTPISVSSIGVAFLRTSSLILLTDIALGLCVLFGDLGDQASPGWITAIG